MFSSPWINLPSNINHVGAQVRDQGHTLQFTHPNQPRYFSSCPCEAFSSDPPACETREEGEKDDH